MILLADTSILIDLEHVSGIGLLPKLAACEVLDVVLAECENEKQPQIIQHIEDAGITVIETSRELAFRANTLRRGGVSTNDIVMPTTMDGLFWLVTVQCGNAVPSWKLSAGAVSGSQKRRITDNCLNRRNFCIGWRSGQWLEEGSLRKNLPD